MTMVTPEETIMGSKVMTWCEYVNWVVGDDRQVEISAKTGVDQGTISRWRKEEPQAVSARSARAFALGYERPVLEAFVVAGFLTEAEAGVRPPGRADLSEVSNERLAAEVKRRLLVDSPLRTLPSMG
jgi:hypothetical protein